MKAFTSMALAAALILPGCAVPGAPASSMDEASMTPLERKAALESQARGIRTRIIQLKQQVVIQEVMLTNVERRAAMSQLALSNLPDTDVLSEAALASAPVRPDAPRLSVVVRPVPVAASTANPPVKKKKKRAGQQSSRPALSRS